MDDYDVISADGILVGRIMRVHAAPKDAPWMWSLAYGQHKDRTPRADARRAVMPAARQELAKGVTPQGPAIGLCPRGRSERWDSPNTLNRNEDMDAIDAFFKTGSQYYIAGRFAAFAWLHPVAGNLFHHAIEMYLKGALSKTKSLSDLRKLSHDLLSGWAAFKVHANDRALDRFDATIAGLHDYEELRYPDLVIAKGMESTIEIVRSSIPTGAARGGTSVPRYRVCVQDIDELVSVIFAAASRNPQAYLRFPNDPAREFLTKDNTVSGLTG